MSVTSVTWGVTTTQTQAIVAQITHSSATFPVTPALFADSLARKAALVNGYVMAAGFTLSDFSSDTTSIAYLRCQDWTARLVACEVIKATQLADTDVAQSLCNGVMDELRDLIGRPALLGQGSGTPNGVSTVVDRRSFKTDETSRAARREWDTLTDRTADADDIHEW